MNNYSLPKVTLSFFGKRNAGKSSLVNAFTSQQMSIVSKIKGTTTDPVKKSMELLPLGPVLVIDTPGIDDEGELGKLRIEKAKRILDSTQIAVFVKDSCEESFSSIEKELLDEFIKRSIPFVIAFNKSDLLEKKQNPLFDFYPDKSIYVSALEKFNIEELKEKIAKLRPSFHKVPFVKDLLKAQDFVVLVIPIDKAAPEGRLILPQQIALRDILDAKAIPVCSSVENLEYTLSSLPKKPAMVITDSQVFAQVRPLVKEDIFLTGFSVLMARFKGTLEKSIHSLNQLDKIKDGDIILISEACTHHRQCGDIGSQKIPELCKKYTGKKINFEFTSGHTFPLDLKKYAMVIHCGGCMQNENEMQNRQKLALEQNIPFTNYGMAIAKMSGIKLSFDEFKGNIIEENNKNDKIEY